MDQRVISVGDDFAAHWVQEYVASRPTVSDALEAANAVGVVFTPQGVCSSNDEFFATVQAALSQAEAAVPVGKRGLFIAVVFGRHARESGAFAICGSKRTGACPPLTSTRGALLGYILLGEGGALFTDDRGDSRGHLMYPQVEYIVDRIHAL
jgi:hypothetical protein